MSQKGVIYFKILISIFLDFSRIYFDFSRVFLILIPLKKGQKRVIFSRRNRGANVAHSRHMAGPREPTWMPVWGQRGAGRSSSWQVMGPRV